MLMFEPPMSTLGCWVGWLLWTTTVNGVAMSSSIQHRSLVISTKWDPKRTRYDISKSVTACCIAFLSLFSRSSSMFFWVFDGGGGGGGGGRFVDELDGVVSWFFDLIFWIWVS